MPDVRRNFHSELTITTYRNLYVTRKDPGVDIERGNALLMVGLRVHPTRSSSDLPSHNCSKRSTVPFCQVIILGTYDIMYVALL
jgi:hypothetical protein